MTNGEKFKTVEERKEPFKRFCNSRLCTDCEIFSRRFSERECGLFWLDLEAEEEKPDNCPYCGAKTRVSMGLPGFSEEHPAFVVCDECGYASGKGADVDEAIARHNALCRRLKGEKS